MFEGVYELKSDSKVMSATLQQFIQMYQLQTEYNKNYYNNINSI